MTKVEIANRVAKETGLTKTKASEAVESLLTILKEALKNEERLEFRGFGVFRVRKRKARTGRNPRTGEEAPISEGRTIKFKPGKEFKEAIINQGE
ncbi:MAG TPA: HU family DNA-binding protein [Candidatus Limnocylindrales bacterium]|nr:HU family DNA-binding protein [Candidatus Limnocylindrales bacterium]